MPTDNQTCNQQLYSALIQDAHKRRQTLLAQLPPNAVLLIAGAQLVPRHNDVDYVFYQRSNFYYLCPFDEPDALLVLHTVENKSHTVLYCQEKTPEQITWTGASMGADKAQACFLLDAAYSNDARDKQLLQLCAQAQHIYYEIADETITNLVRQLQASKCSPLRAVTDISHTLHSMRRIKSDTEIACMEKAAAHSAHAFIHSMQQSTIGTHEYQLAADFAHQCALQGSRQLAYPTICASGHNACVLHYLHNAAPLQQNTLVLMDAGCEHLRYASDITRSWVPNGVWSDAHKDLYQLVLDVQIGSIACVRPGVLFSELQRTAIHILTEGLIALGVIHAHLDDAIEQKLYQPYYMHGCSHWLGLDVHDPCPYTNETGESIELAAGMSFTIEPGLYMRDHAHYGTCGIRIEDDVVVTQTGVQVLSQAAPKTIDELSALCSSNTHK